MKTLALTAAVLVSITTAAMGEDVFWPELQPGEVKVIGPGDKVPDIVRKATGYDAPAEIPKDVKITMFMAPHRSEYLIISPCCGPQGGGASFFVLIGDTLRPEPLTVGDPRKGFTSQPFADSITVDAGAKTLRARIGNADCETGTWGYFYKFDEIDRPALVSVIDTSCAHLGVRELFHTPASVSHWWQH